MNIKRQAKIANHKTGFFGKDQSLQNPLWADFILTRSNSWQSLLISIGQKLRFRGDKSNFAHWTHAAIVVSEDGAIIEALNSGVVQRSLNDYLKQEYVVVRVDCSLEDKTQIINYAKSALGRRYGWLQIVSLSLSLLTGLKFNFGIDDQMICSGLVASSLERGNDIFERIASFMTPADLAYHYKVQLPTTTADTKV